MIGCGVSKSLETVRLRRWNDKDLEEDLDFLHGLLTRRTKQLSHWKVYEVKVETGVLRWDDMLHTTDFFQTNAKRMEGPGGDFDLVKRLIGILYNNTKSGRFRRSGKTSYVGLNEVGRASWDRDDVADDEISELLSVCLFDIGEFARHYPNGRGVAKRLGAKHLVMQYVNHPRWEVQEQALLCASKLLVNNWRAIGTT
mmetsp:Transcript_27834/g.58337  ORF Transcript_27834/g.58337 Transcript_27834/m.58337 type:complete len:198 (+) Transcript_27834:546-1139(+)